MSPPQSRPAQARETTGLSGTDQGTRIGAVDAWLREHTSDDFIVQPVANRGPATPQSRFRSLQSWEGRVIEVCKDSFVAVLEDLTMPGTEEQVELDLGDVSPDDGPLVVPGAVFYWSIGYREDPSGARSRSSELRFQRLPRWSSKDVSGIADRVEALKARTGIGR